MSVYEFESIGRFKDRTEELAAIDEWFERQVAGPGPIDRPRPNALRTLIHSCNDARWRGERQAAWARRRLPGRYSCDVAQ